MTYLFYHIGLTIFYLLIFIACPFNSKAKLWIRGRSNWKRCLEDYKFRENSWVWFHCSSLGEYEDGKTFIKAFKNEYPIQKILITFSSPSGFEIKKNKSDGDHVMYLPLDFYSNAKFFFQKINIHSVFFVRNDIWINYLRVARDMNIPVFHLSSLVDGASGFTKKGVRFFYRMAFSCFDHLMVQDENTKAILEKKLSMKKSTVVGNLRVDAVLQTLQSNFLISRISDFVGNDFCVIGGSLLRADISNFLFAYETLKKEKIKWILVPHEIKSDEIDEILVKLRGEAFVYSKMQNMKDGQSVLVIDCVGILPFLYRYSNLAYIGGGFNRIGIHNILEPCVFGNAIVTGPNIRNYREALDLSSTEVLKIITHSEALVTHIKTLTKNKNSLEKISNKAVAYIEKRKGATEKAMQIYKDYFNKCLNLERFS